MSVNTTCTILPKEDHTHTIIFLHGRGSNADEFASELLESQASDDRLLTEIFPPFKWVFPSSPSTPSSRFKAEMTQWFDIWAVEDPEERAELQLQGLRESVLAIWKIIQAEAAVVPMDRIFIAGISQGCATAIHALLGGGVKLGGFIGLCGWLPFRGEVEALAAEATIPTPVLDDIRESLSFAPKDPEDRHKISSHALQTPVFLGHCADDGVVPVANGEKLCQGLRSLNMDCTWRSYEDGGHWINEPRGIDDIVMFIRRNT